MTTKTDIKKILSKGLTGKEAGKLILQDSWDVDHRREGFLSDRDISAIKASLKTTQDQQDYNSYIDTYRRIDYTLKEAHIKTLEAEVRIDAIQTLMYLYFFDSASEIEMISRPVIMTEKQYQENKAKQRERLLKDTHTIRDILSDRARELYPEHKAEYEKADEEAYYIDFLNEYYPDKCIKTISEILELLKAGQLKPVALSKRMIQKLKVIVDKQGQARARMPINQLSREELQELALKGKQAPSNKEAEQELGRLYKEYEKTEYEAYQTGKNKQSQESQAKIINMLEQLLNISTEEQEQLLDYTFCLGEELYQTGLPEWLKWIDEYKPGFYDEAEGDSYRGIAILVDPSPHQVDERGYYIGYKKRIDIKEISGQVDMADTFTIGLWKLNEELKIVLAFHCVIEAVSEAMGIDFAKDTRGWIQDLRDKLDTYNDLLDRGLPSVPDSLKDVMKPVDIDQWKPSAKTIKYLKERIAIGLGEGWWVDAKNALEDDLREKEALYGQEA